MEEVSTSVNLINAPYLYPYPLMASMFLILKLEKDQPLNAPRLMYYVVDYVVCVIFFLHACMHACNATTSGDFICCGVVLRSC